MLTSSTVMRMSSTSPMGRDPQLPRYMNKAVLHEYLEVCSNYTTDPFWKKKICEAARGTFPSGVKYVGNELQYNSPCGYSSDVLPSEPELAIEVFINFYRLKKSLSSDMDIERGVLMIAEMEESRTKNCSTQWTKLAPGVKVTLLEKFISDQATALNLSQSDRKKLKSTVFGGMTTKILNKKSVVLVDGKIEELVGLRRDMKARTFYFVETKKAKNRKVAERKVVMVTTQIMHRPGVSKVPEKWNDILSYYDYLSKTTAHHN